MIAPVYEALRHGLRVPERLTPKEFAERHVLIPHSARSARFDGDTARWLNDPMAAVADNANSEVMVCAPVGSGKTTMFEVLLPYIISQDSGPSLIVFQSDEDSKEWSETRFWPILKLCEPVAPFFPKDRHAKRKSEILFPHMPLFIAGANPSSLQSKSIRWCIGDEVWMWRPGMIEEFRRRTHDRWNSRVFLVSQAGVVGDGFHGACEAGQKHEWNWECPHCKHVHPFRLGDLKYDEVTGPDGLKDWTAIAKSARMTCPSCEAVFTDTAENRRALADSGRYVAEDGSFIPRRKTYHYNALTVWWIEWGKLVVEWLNANDLKRQGNLEPLKQFLQKRLAQFWKEEESVPWGALQGAGYTKSDYAEGQLWDGEMYRLMTVDVQRDHYWYLIRSWKADGSSRLLSEGRAVTKESLKALADQYKVKPILTFPDAQHNTGEIYEMCALWGWTAMHGSGESGFKHYPKGSSKPVTKFYSAMQFAQAPSGARCRYVFWSNEKVKDVLARLRTGQGAAWETPDDVSEDYAKQIDSEVKKEVINKKTKAVANRWVKIKNDNHLWDCEAMQTAAAMMIGVIRGE